MRLLSGHNTMRNAKPKFRDANDGVVVRTIEQIRAEKRREAINREAIEREVRRRVEARAEFERKAREHLETELAEMEARLQSMRETFEDQQSVVLRSRVSLDTIVKRICRATGCTRADLISRKRYVKHVLARQAVFYWAARLTPLSYPRIGHLLGGRDHTTILYGAKVYPKKRAEQGRYLRPIKR